MGHVEMVTAKDLLANRHRTMVKPFRLVVLCLRHVNCRESVEGMRIARVVDSELRLRGCFELLCFRERCNVISTRNELPDRIDVGLLRDRWADNEDAHPQASEAGADNRSLRWHQVSPQVADSTDNLVPNAPLAVVVHYGHA